MSTFIKIMNVATYDELTELLITDQIKQKISPEIKEHFIVDLPKIKEVDGLVEKLDDFEMALRGFKIAKLQGAQNSLVLEEKGYRFLQNPSIIITNAKNIIQYKIR